MTSSCIPAHALTPVRDYKGPCTLVLSKRSIGVSTENENLGTWPFECIRRFHSQDLNYFSFTSGRRGPYGVCDYTFKIKDEDLKKVQDILSQHTGAKFDSPRSFRSGSGSSSLVDSNPNDTVFKSGSYSHVSSPQNTTQPGYTTMTIPQNLPEDVNSKSLFQRIPPLSPLTCPVPFLNKEKVKDYDRLENAKKDAAAFVDGISPIKHNSIEQNGQEETSDLDQNLSKQEIRQIKKFNKEELVNKSPNVHVRQNAQYVDIDLTDSESEDTGSQPTSNQHNHPTSLIEQSIYDVPPPPIPLVENTYDTPSSIHRQSVENVYGIPRSTKSPLQRALPHLPTDYENISPPGQKIIGNRSYVNVGRGETGLYMEVPLTLGKIQSKSMINIYHNIPERLESQLTIRRVESDRTTTAGERLAKELAEEGYEFVKPALLPALISPPPVSIEPVLEVPDEEQETDEYIEVHRSKSPTNDNAFLKVTSTMPGRSKRGKDGYEVVDDKFHKTSNISIDKQHECRRWSDGYEDINEVIKEMQPETTLPKGNDSYQDTVNNSEVMNETSVTMKELQLHSDISDEVYTSMDSGDLQSHKSSPLSIPTRTYIPTALGSPDAAHAILLRKRSLTIGDPLDNKEAKKHTYVNVPDDSSVPQRSFTGESVKKKPPMPLPRPTSSKDVIIDSGANENHSNNKVKSLVRQFSSDC